MRISCAGGVEERAALGACVLARWLLLLLLLLLVAAAAVGVDGVDRGFVVQQFLGAGETGGLANVASETIFKSQ